jgi:Phage terminase, small subunit
VSNRGNPSTLVSAHPGNSNRLVHGYYSGRPGLSEQAIAIADLLMEAPHVVPLDRIAAEEIGALMDLIGKIDAALADGRVENRRTLNARNLIDVRNRLSKQLSSWLREFGLTPAARAEWAAKLAQPSFQETVERIRRETEESNGRR